MTKIMTEKSKKVKIEFAKNRTVASTFLVVFFSIVSIIALIPFYAMFLASFKPATELFRYGLNLRLDFNIMNINNYIPLFNDDSIPYLIWYKNSLIITVLGTVLSLLFSSMVGYGLAMYEFKGKNLVFVLVLFIMMVPVEILILPLYNLTVSFRIINTYWGVILPFIVSVSGVFFFRQYASGLSKDFMDSARIDGCSEYGIYARIMVPLMKPAFGAMAILIALGNWNSFLWPLIVMRTDDMFTLPVGLMSLLTPYGNNYSAVLSGSVLSVLPILILFIINQESFVAGLTAGGVKG
jgi:arabinosaccharide transport system permease protein